MNDDELYERLAAASSLENEDAAIRIGATYEPIGGAADKISPPTYPVGSAKKPPYLLEKRWDGDGHKVRTVLLDSRQAQANRCEEALQLEIDAGRLKLPQLVLATEAHGTPIRITSLEAPHRSRDAYFRDAEAADGTLFDQTPPGEALKVISPEDASSLYRYSPADLIYGVWDSHRDLRLATRLPRFYTSEMVGWDALTGLRAAGRFDLVVSGGRKVEGGNEDWAPGDGKNLKKPTKLSKLGHGSIPPGTSHTVRGRELLNPGGVVVKRITRSASVGFAGLARVRFGQTPVAAARAGRAVLGALALLADRLAFGQASVFLRSGCELVLREETLAWVTRSGAEEPLDINVESARRLVDHAVGRAESKGLVWEPEAVVLRPQSKLQQVIEEAYYSTPASAEEDDQGST